MAVKIIENRKTVLTIKDGDSLRKMNYFDLIKLSFDVQPKGGFTRDDIKKRNRIEEKLIGESAELEHDEFYSMKKICNEVGWPNRHKDIESFLNYLDDIK